ncbi:rhomboid protease GluP [Natronobacillus azotifigens]|uniref:Rhomboid family intramembrane serine protease n=1 Tax=Natronobacillus azotifigens TaxID=472978 RepID=A0A9J6RFE8_9BACI|nr:rhomboid family intramembrane serine protease [Natronobacillus azotifigens]MCZ0704059.1 rhomboid family intramembrane serine protease [Natronobacillus azotifigens]
MQNIDLGYHYKLIFYLIERERFELIHIDDQQQSIWLQKKKGKRNLVLCLKSSDFHWSNQLKLSYIQTIKQTNALQSEFIGGKIELIVVYVGEHTPVDNRDHIETKLSIDKVSISKHYLFYLDHENRELEMKRFCSLLQIRSLHMDVPNDPMELESEILCLKKTLHNIYYKQKKANKLIFHQATPILVYYLLGINVIYFLLLEWHGGSTSIETLIHFGAKYNPAIAEGEWWRIIKSMFLHIGLLHLIMNMLALHILGCIVEQMYRATRFLFIYFSAGIMGGLASFAFNNQVSAGASAAIFGLLGALLYFGTQYKQTFLQTIGKNIFFVVALNLIIGTIVPAIDNAAHIGGLLGGFFSAAVVSLPRKNNFYSQLFAAICYGLLAIGLASHGFQKINY